MALNQPWSDDEYRVDDIIQDNLTTLCEELRKKERVELEVKDFNYELFTRCESLSVKSELLYPNEDLPGNFGVYRGYNGGGIHGGLCKTEIYNITPRRQAKAERILAKIEDCFWQILKDVDNADEAETGEEKQNWDKLTL
jgi:hypothetical protein